jgi:hypothetical protein
VRFATLVLWNITNVRPLYVRPALADNVSYTSHGRVFAGYFTAPQAFVAGTEEHMSSTDEGNDRRSETEPPLEIDPADDAVPNSRTATVEAMISFLRTEALLAEERAKELRNRAKNLAEQFRIEFSHDRRHKSNNQGSDAATHVDSEMAPLDEHGNPKYKGKKRGRKPKPRRRKHNPDRQKRKHTGYTLFVQETHPLIKNDNSNITNSQIVSIVAKRWRDLSESQRRQWKERALSTTSIEDQAVHSIVHNDGQHDDASEGNSSMNMIVEKKDVGDELSETLGRKRSRRQN